MNCREAENLIFAARDGALDSSQRAALASHLTQCPACQAMQADFEAAATAWRASSAAIKSPAVETEWHVIRRRIRADQPEASAVRWGRPTWLSVAATLAAVAIAALFGPRWFRGEAGGPGADADYVSYVVVHNTSDATMVYEDAASGWLVVWVSDDGATSGT